MTLSGSNIYAGTGGGVYLSTDNGISWSNMGAGGTNCVATNGTNIFAGTYSQGVFLSSNNGASWIQVNNGLNNLNILSLSVSGSNILAGTNGGGVYLSTNNGTNWIQVNLGLTNINIQSFVVNGANIYAGSDIFGGGVYLSSNSGNSWTQTSNGLTNTNINSLAMNNSNMYAGTNGGVFLSTNNGSNWLSINNGLTNTTVESIVTIYNYIFAGTQGGVFVSTNNGSNWTQVNNGLTNTLVWSLAIVGTKIFAGTVGGGIYMSTNYGSNWVQVNNGLANLNILTIAASGTSLYAGTLGLGAIFKSTNNGTNWTQVNNGLTNLYVQCLITNGSNVYAGTGEGVYISTNNGASWEQINNNGLNVQYINSLTINGSNLFAGTHGGIFILNLEQPSVLTNAASNITQSSSTLNGTVNPKGSSTTVQFEYGTSTSYGNTINAAQSPLNGNNDVNVSANITGLAPNTLYHYRVEATNSAGTSYGNDLTFTTQASINLSSVITTTATNIAATTASSGGNVTSDGGANITARGICWNTSGNPTTANSNTSDGTGTGSFTSNMTGLSSNTLYYYRAYATNSAGTSYGSDFTFTTLSNQPTVTTNSATNITQTAATLNGIVNPNGIITTVQFEYGTTTTYGNTFNAIPSPIIGNAGVNVSLSISGLTSNTTYHYRVKAANNTGTSYGSDVTFITNSLKQIAGFEGNLPSYWNIDSQPTGSTLSWATDQSLSMGHSIKIQKDITSDSASWISDNMCDMWSPTILANIDLLFGAWIKTSGVNTNPTSDDQRWYIAFSFYDSTGNVIGIVKLPINQTQSTSNGWLADTTAMGQILLPKDAYKLIISFVGGKNATGTVWADNFIFTGRETWAGQDWNTQLGVPTGWYYWMPPNGGNDGLLNSGFENSTVTNEFAHTGNYSFKFNLPFGRKPQDGFIGTHRLPFSSIDPNIKPGDNIRVSVWVKASNLVPDSALKNPTTWTVGITPQFFTKLGNNDGWDGAGDDFYFTFPNTTSFDWTQCSANIPVPSDPNISGMEIHLHIFSRFTGIVYFDDLNVENISSSLPIVTTAAVTNINQTTTTLNGIVNPNGLSTTVQFDYGTTTNYGNTVAADQSPLSGNSNTSASANINGLTPNTVYHYRVEATNSAGTSYGADSTFITLSNMPIVTTKPATNITQTSATLTGIVNPNSLNTIVQFEYGTTTSYGNIVSAVQSPLSGSTNANVSSNITDLGSNMLYHFRVKATNSAGTSYGADSTFTTSSNLPGATTISASNILQTSATLNGVVNPSGMSTTVQFEYGTTTSYGNIVTATPGTVNGESAINVSAEISSLTPNLIYHFRIVARNNKETYYSSDSTFTTLAIKPIVSTNKATNIYQDKVTLNGIVNPNGASTTVEFEYGTTSNYGITFTADQSPVTSNGNVSANITALTPNTIYHYRLVATNSGGTSFGVDSIFKTLSNPTEVTTLAASNISLSTSTLNGVVNPNGISTTVHFEYGITTSYGDSIEASQSPINGNNNVNVDANLSNLIPNTTYHYRIVAGNNAGTSYGADSTLTTLANQAIVSTNIASSITESAALLNGIVKPNGLSTIVEFEYGLTTSYGNTSVAAQSPISGNNNINVSYEITGLMPNTVYHYRVKATNNAGVSYGGDLTFITLSNQATATTSSSENITQTAVTLNGTVNPSGLSTIVQFEYGISASYGSTITASQSPINGNSEVNVSADLSGLNANTLYHYRIKAENNVGIVYGTDLIFKTLFIYPSILSLNRSYSFNDPNQSSSYQLIGLPGDIYSTLNQLFGGTPKQDWDAYYDNGNASNYLIEFDNSSLFQFNPGNGFWIIGKNTLSISENVNTVTLNSQNAYLIPTHSGWNIISNPFDKSIIWDSVISTNSLDANSLIYSWNAGWNTAASFDPYMGYYFYNQQNLSSLKIPYNPDGVIGKLLRKTASLINDNGNNSLKLSLVVNNKENSFVVISLDSTSSDGFDKQDILIPPADFEDAGINLINNNLSIGCKYLLKETRPQNKEGQAFNLNIIDKRKKQIDLIADGADNFKVSEVYLLDYNNHKMYNLKQKNLIKLSPVEKSNYQILIGSSDFINSKEKEILPTEFKLYQNYPNPFNPTTTIEYSIPKTSYVTLKIYDILGKLVTTLVNESKEAGYYKVELNGSNFSSGIYFYRIEAGKFIDTKKLLLLK